MVCQHQAAHAVAHRDVRATLCESHLYAGWAPWDELCQPALTNPEKALVHICWVHLALDDVENRDVAAFLARYGRDHPILGLQQSSHDIQYRRLPHCLGLLDLVAREWRIRGHQEVTPRCGNQRGQYADEVVVHVARVPQCCRARRHDGRDKLVGLLERRLLHVESVGRDVRQSAVVENHYRVGILRQPPHRQHTIVGMHDDISGICRVWEHGVCLDDLLGEPVVQPLEQKGP